MIPPILDEIGAALEAAVRSDHARAPAPRRRWWRGAALGVTLTAGAGTVALAAGVLSSGSVAPPKAADLSPATRPVPGSAHLSTARAADPLGGPPWTVRRTRSQAGLTCLAAGQLQRGAFGIVGLDRRFRTLPLGGGDLCTAAPGPDGVTADVRPVIGTRAEGPRTVLSLLAGTQVGDVTLNGRPLPLGTDRLGVAALRGDYELIRPVVSFRRPDGTRGTVRFGNPRPDEVADPAGGARWHVDGASRSGRCAQLIRESGPGVPLMPDGRAPVSGPFSDIFCTARSSLLIVRRYVPDERQGWSLEPARTLVLARLSPRIDHLEVRRPGARPVSVRRFADGAAALVLPGRVDPARVRVFAVDPAGRRRGLPPTRRPTDDEGHALRLRRRSPAFRTVAAASAATPPSFADPVPGSTSIGAPVLDPLGGPGWAARTWRGRLHPGTRYSGPTPGPFACFQVGPLIGGTVRAPRSGPPGRALNQDEQDGLCNDDRPPKRIADEVLAYVDDPLGADPRVVRLAIEGQVPTATQVELYEQGAWRALPLHDGAFLALLDGRRKHGPLALRATLASGTTLTSALGNQDLITAAPRVDARAPDPDGGPSWAIVEQPQRGQSVPCERTGQIVAGHLAAVSAFDGSVTLGASGSAHCGPPGLKLAPLFDRFPVELSVEEGSPALRQGPTLGQIERRTRPGRTIISGAMRPDVVSAIVGTPRGPLTLLPSGPGHAFIAILDGMPYGEPVSILAHLRDGRMVRQSFGGD